MDLSAWTIGVIFNVERLSFKLTVKYFRHAPRRNGTELIIFVFCFETVVIYAFSTDKGI